MKSFGLLASVATGALIIVLANTPSEPERASVAAQLGPTATSTPFLGGTGYYFSLPGNCPGTPLASMPANVPELQVNVVWDQIPTDKARFRMGQRSAEASAPLMTNDVLFERNGTEQYRCATVSREVFYATSGSAYFDHQLLALDDQGGYISVTPNPVDMKGDWSFEAMETVEPVSTPLDPDRGTFWMEVSTAPMIYTRADDNFNGAPVNQFPTTATVYLLQPAPCPADYTLVTVTGPQGFYWEEGRGRFCRSYAGIAYTIGSSLAPGDYVASAYNEGFAPAMFTWAFTVVP